MKDQQIAVRAELKALENEKPTIKRQGVNSRLQ
jgi:hypothetical protein